MPQKRPIVLLKLRQEAEQRASGQRLLQGAEGFEPESAETKETKDKEMTEMMDEKEVPCWRICRPPERIFPLACRRAAECQSCRRRLRAPLKCVAQISEMSCCGRLATGSNSFKACGVRRKLCHDPKLPTKPEGLATDEFAAKLPAVSLRTSQAPQIPVEEVEDSSPAGQKLCCAC